MIEGSKIGLRKLHVDDLNVYRQWNQPGQAWQELDGPYYPKRTPAEVEATVENLKARIEADNWPPVPLRLVIAQADSDRMIGLVSRYWISEETQWAAIGIVIYDPAHWRHGIGYEALGLWTDYLFEQQPDWVRLDLRTWSGNTGMMRLAEKLGYTLEARFHKARVVNGQYYDGLGYGVLREEWQAHFRLGFRTTI